MSIKKNLLIIGMAFLVLACGATKEKTESYVILDADQTAALMTNYMLEVPKNWYSYFGFHDMLSHSPNKSSILKENYYKSEVKVYSYDTDSFHSNDIETALKAHVVGLDLDNMLKPVIDFEEHAIYGKYYLIKRRFILNGDLFLNLRALFNYKNQDYIISYNALEKDFETYLPEVIQMIATFKIKEMP
ncbi:hypothetical protein [Bizionia myxarmorum]|uniref:Gliding motility lipoprotein GldD n=1 Tax=Bizionia myxarmorum TaxID=291186 RepID=A0A5D0RDC9_9FLAO|nr:hypothetical protein [Bizionia myxarmorum]TYB78946.1 hypothetical protein ES674_04000 [Bizionia myxarmorum]